MIQTTTSHRNDDHFVPRVAAIHDLSGFGRAALTVVIPILSSMGVQVCPLPTAVFSTHGAFPGYAAQDLTEFMRDCLAHWQSLNIRFDAIYSGFLNSVRQIEVILEFLRQPVQRNRLIVIDPVLGDSGRLYSVTDPELVDGMREYMRGADVITPNLTETALLLDEPYRPDILQEELREWLIRLAERGPRLVIVTSVPEPRDPARLAVLAYQHEEQRFQQVSCEVIAGNFPGTGDLFTSVVVGNLLHGIHWSDAVERAVHFVSTALRTTVAAGSPFREGVLLESVLHQPGTDRNREHQEKK